MKISEYQAILKDLKKRKIPAEIKEVVETLLDKKAEKTVVLKLKGLSKVTDYLIICHGNSTRQNKALSDEIQKRLKRQCSIRPYSVEGEPPADWILIDYIDFIVHIFTFETREKYILEKLWMDAKRYNFYFGQ